MFLLWTYTNIDTVFLTNILCNNSDWSIDSGTWDFNLSNTDINNCSLTNTNKADNRVWFDNVDGSSYNSYYSTESFVFEARLSLASDSDQAGILFRTSSMSNFYWLSIRQSDYITLYKCCYSGIFSVPYTIDYDTIYSLKVIGDGVYYDFYINNEIVAQKNILDDLTIGSIGIISYNAYATFYSLNFTKLLSNDTNLYESNNDGLLCVNNNDLNLYLSAWLYHEYNNTCVIENTDDGSNRAWFGSVDGTTYNTDYDSESFIFESFVSIASGNDQGGLGFRLVNPANTFYWLSIRASADAITLYKCCYSTFFDVSYTIEHDTFYKLKIEANGIYYNFYIDDQLIAQKTELIEITYGSIGYISHNGYASFKSTNYTTLPNATDLYYSNETGLLCINDENLTFYQSAWIFINHTGSCGIENTNTGANIAWYGSIDNVYTEYYDSESFIFESFVSIASGNDQGGLGFRVVDPENTFYW